MEIIDYIFFKMTWLSDLIDLLITKVFNLPINNESLLGKFGGSLHFFIYDSIKITILLSVLVFIFGYVESRFTVGKTREILSKLKGVKGSVIGALMGTITPFCSCSSIPIFISFVRAGLPMEVTFSFLISSPFVDLASTILLASIFGIKVAVIYVVFGVLLAVIGGLIISKFNLEKHIESFVFKSKNIETKEEELTRKDRLIYAKDQVKNIYTKVWKYILLGVLIGSIIHNWIPQNLIENILGKNNIFAPLLATIVGVPMYADIFGTIPIAEALFLKGVGIGTILAFMMSVTALSIPSIIMLKKVMKKELLISFVVIIVIGILIIGYMFNILHYLVI